ncbi:MAG: acyl-CoA thioesterase [Sutterella sp.]|jgi:putative 4-hydroxybenzoyl-coA thioesterase family protein|nr:acyl-CoA thioesterase [Sutterella sp.]MDY3273078.1 thioesterase family protein [Duodenibacillus sp.]
MHKIFTRPIHIRFAQCDSAGIVFHPQFLTIFNGLIEDFFSDVVGKPFPTILQDGLMIPVAGLQCNFLSPCRAGDRLTASLWIEKLGYSSVRFAMTLSRGNDDCVRLVETMVCVSQEKGFKPIAWPEDFRSAMLDYVAGSDVKPLALRL